MLPDFTNFTDYNEEANFSLIKHGAEALVLESEMNELQLIILNKLKGLINDRFGNSFYMTGSLDYTGGTLTFSNDKAIANGNILNISELSLALGEGETAYLDVWEQEVDFDDDIKKYGNQQEVTITNHIMDSRVSEETTRRIQIQYNIVKTTGVAGHTYLEIARIDSGVVVDLRTAVNMEDGIYTDRSSNPDYVGVKYQIAVYEGQAYLEVVEV